MNMTQHKSGLRWLWLAVLAFVLDQASKLAVVKLLPFGYPGVEITPSSIWFTSTTRAPHSASWLIRGLAALVLRGAGFCHLWIADPLAAQAVGDPALERYRLFTHHRRRPRQRL